MAPVAGIPPNITEAMFPRPWAVSSAFELLWELTILSATTQESSDSIAAKIAMVKASGKTAEILEKLISIPFKAKGGSPEGIVYKSPMVLTPLPKTGMNFTITAPTITAISEGGIFFSNLG